MARAMMWMNYYPKVFANHIHRRLQNTVFVSQIIDIKRLTRNEMLAKESVADLPFRVFRFDDFKLLVSKIFQCAFPIGLPRDLQGFPKAQIIYVDFLAFEIARAVAFQ